MLEGNRYFDIVSLGSEMETHKQLAVMWEFFFVCATHRAGRLTA